MVQVRMTMLTMAWMYTTPSACHGLYVHMQIIVYVYRTCTLKLRALKCGCMWPVISTYMLPMHNIMHIHIYYNQGSSAET